MTTEADIKRDMIKSMHEGGHYARRLEDKFAVGVFDTILIPTGMPVFMAEVKRVRDNVFGPTPRQLIELHRIRDVAEQSGHVIPLMIGWHEGVYYFHKPKVKINRAECFSITTSDVPFYKQLILYYYSQKGLPK
jgi:hypothetical protein